MVDFIDYNSASGGKQPCLRDCGIPKSGNCCPDPDYLLEENCSKPIITSQQYIQFLVGGSISYEITSDDSTATYQVTGLPEWASFDGTTISGTTDQGGIYSLNILSTNSCGTSVAPIVITVIKPPSTENISITVKSGIAYSINLNNFVTVGTSPLNPSSFIITDNPTNGTIVDYGTGNLVYTANSGYSGSDSFQWSVADINGNVSNISQVDITVQIRSHYLITSNNSGNSGDGAFIVIDPPIIAYPESFPLDLTIYANGIVSDIVVPPSEYGAFWDISIRIVVGEGELPLLKIGWSGSLNYLPGDEGIFNRGDIAITSQDITWYADELSWSHDINTPGNNFEQPIDVYARSYAVNADGNYVGFSLTTESLIIDTY